MKFLCDNCKAKYQIADDKVAGKTVRMKCRKCGHQIEVRAAVTETSVSTSPPNAPETSAPRPAARSGLATSLAGTKPRAPAASTPNAQNSALAGAFQRTVQDPPQASHAQPQPQQPIELSVTDEWYVAINGVPVGPVRISELRRKAAAGAVTEDSLCWQEGLEEWRPVRSVPELAAIVREAAQGNRPSLISPPPDGGRASSPPRPPPRPASRPDMARVEPTRPMAPPARSNVVPLRVAASSNEDLLAGLSAPFGGAGSAAALAPSPALSPQPAPVLAPTPAPVAVADPFALPPPAPLAAPAASQSAATSASASIVPPAPFQPSMVPPAPRRAGVPLWFYLVALFTVSFGGVAAYALFFRQQPPPAPVVINMPPTNQPTATTPAGDIPPPPPTAPEATASATSSAKVAAGPAKGTGGGAVAAATPEKKTADLSGLLGGAGGPGVGGGPAGAGGGGGGLDSSSVERVVAQHRTGVKRTCWERGGDQKSSVNVTVSATVAPDGSVASTSSNGDDPVVAKCIESQVRGWRFAAPGSTTTVNIPFKFVRQ